MPRPRHNFPGLTLFAAFIWTAVVLEMERESFYRFNASHGKAARLARLVLLTLPFLLTLDAGVLYVVLLLCGTPIDWRVITCFALTAAVCLHSVVVRVRSAFLGE